MVVRMMRWRPWPPLVSRKYEVKLTVGRLEGSDWVDEVVYKDNGGLAVEIRWKGPKISLGSFRKNVKKNCTREEIVKRVDGENGGVLVEWNEEFQNVCSLSGYKENVFHPWEINFTVLHGLNQGIKNKNGIVGSAIVNLAELASKLEDHCTEVKVPIVISSIAVERRPLLFISIALVELRGSQESTDILRSPTMLTANGEISTEKDEVSALKAGLRKVKIFTEYVSIKRAKKNREEGSENQSSTKSDMGDYSYSFDSDTLDEFEEGESDEGKRIRKSFSYGTLAFANYAGVFCYSNAVNSNDDENFVYYSNRRKSDVGCCPAEELSTSVPEQPFVSNSKRSILPWRKRKLSFRSPKPRGEPLLKKAYGEEGGDDIDYDRRQLSSDESLGCWNYQTDENSNANRSSVSEFGDDGFAVGAWEQKEIISRDGQMKIQTQVFFASIDQRSERAAGESACTALVAVIADWLQNNQTHMPIKSQFDSLIREGSLEWRNLCENETYRERFPDKHFDLETVLEAKIRNLSVVPEKSFVGFFRPEEGNFDFLHGAMSFDNIWDEININSNNTEAPVFIVSWNDHFFVLKVESDAYYIIDTLGERLYEGCSEAYILKFDEDTSICKLPAGSEPVDKESAVKGFEEERVKKEEVVCCKGKESCKEYIKNFLAAIPIRELQGDMKKGLMGSTLLHHRLQIEFHFTESQQPPSSSPLAITLVPQEDEVAV